MNLEAVKRAYRVFYAKIEEYCLKCSKNGRLDSKNKIIESGDGNARSC